MARGILATNIMATFADIKTQLGFANIGLPLTIATDEKGKKTDWLRNWDNNNRVNIVIHKDTVEMIKKDPASTVYGIKTSEKKGAKGKYTLHVIVAYTTVPDVIL